MNKKTENSINHYVELFSAIEEKTNSDEISIVILQEIGKDKRSKGIAESYNNTVATERQKNWLKNLSVEFDDSITKKDASDLIAKHSRRE